MKVYRIKNSNKINARAVLMNGDTVKLERKLAESLVGKELPKEYEPLIEKGSILYLYSNSKEPYRHLYSKKFNFSKTIKKAIPSKELDNKGSDKT